jgi:hypothetical protein
VVMIQAAYRAYHARKLWLGTRLLIHKHR